MQVYAMSDVIAFMFGFKKENDNTGTTAPFLNNE